MEGDYRLLPRDFQDCVPTHFLRLLPSGRKVQGPIVKDKRKIYTLIVQVSRLPLGFYISEAGGVK